MDNFSREIGIIKQEPNETLELKKKKGNEKFTGLA